jgi:hypothetical protein
LKEQDRRDAAAQLEREKARAQEIKMHNETLNARADISQREKDAEFVKAMMQQKEQNVRAGAANALGKARLDLAAELGRARNAIMRDRNNIAKRAVADKSARSAVDRYATMLNNNVRSLATAVDPKAVKAEMQRSVDALNIMEGPGELEEKLHAVDMLFGGAQQAPAEEDDNLEGELLQGP